MGDKKFSNIYNYTEQHHFNSAPYQIIGILISGIYSSESKNEYIITVSDNGIGMNDEEHPDFNASGKQSSSAHVGLGNVISRVKYLYREKADIKIDSKYGVGTSITISLNLEPEDAG